MNDDRVSLYGLDEGDRGGGKVMKALEDECFGGDETRTVLERSGYRRTKDVDKEYSAFLLIYRRKDMKDMKVREKDAYNLY